MNSRSLIKNFSIAVIAQGIALVMSFLQSLVIPKLLVGDAYGYWQLFIFYSGYVGFFHLGLNDGIYLLEGGHTRNQIDKRSVNSQLLFSIGIETVFALIILAIAFLGSFDSARVTVLVATALYIIIRDVADYLALVLQAMNETQFSSYSTVVERVSFVVLVFVLMLLNVTDFVPYIIMYMCASFARMAYCVFQMRDFIKSGMYSFSKTLRLSIDSIRVGIKLMVASTASGLIIGIARFGIDNTWDINTFGKLSLSFSLVSFYMQFIMQASMVLFPAMRQSTQREVQSFIRGARSALCVLLPAAYVLYFPMTWILGLWLPEYADSFTYFIYLIPICVFDGMMDITCTTYFKVARKESELFIINVVTALCSALGTGLGTMVFRSIYAVIASIVLCIATRSMISEHIVSRHLKIPTDSIVYVQIPLTLSFIVVATIFDAPLACAVTVSGYLAFLAMYRTSVRTLIQSVGTFLGERS